MMKWLVSVLMCGCAAWASAESLEKLGEPCRAFNVLAGRAITDPAGKSWLVMTNMNENTGSELLFIDYAANMGRTFRAPAGAGSWALDRVPDDRLIVGTYYDGTFMNFDLRQMKFTKKVKVPGEEYIWNQAIGGDGRLYGGTYGGGKLIALDLEKFTVEDLGNPAPPNMYLRNVSAVPDGRILCQFGMGKPKVLLFDPKTKKFADVPETLKGVNIGVTWNGLFVAGNRVFEGPEFAVVDPPFPLPPKEKGAWSVDAYATGAEVLVLRQKDAIYTYKTGEKELRLVSEASLGGGRLLGISPEGKALGVRGQDYWVASGKELLLRPIPAETSPRATHFLRADGAGRLWGGPTFGQTLFWMDAATKKFTNTSQVSDHGGEVYDAAFTGGKVYAVAYAGGEIIEYDPSAAWDQINGKNPRTVAKVGPDYIRPIAGVMVGPDGKLYSGWMARYGTYGGCVAITDASTGKTERMENPLGEQAIGALAVDEHCIYAATNLGGNGLPSKQGEPTRFGVINIADRKVVWQQDMDKGVGSLFFDKKSARVAMSVGGALKLFDPEKKAIADGPKAAPSISRDIVGIGDGRIWYGSDKALAEVNLVTGAVRKLLNAPAKISSVAVDPKGNLFIACESDVYRVKR